MWADLGAVDEHGRLDVWRYVREGPPALRGELVGDVEVAVLGQRDRREHVLLLVDRDVRGLQRPHPDTECGGDGGDRGDEEQERAHVNSRVTAPQPPECPPPGG
ncbi:MAG: hypothetical protein ACRDRH_21880 [Pseudonocardia sp.]